MIQYYRGNGICQPYMADICKKEFGVDIDVENPNVEVISLLDVDKCVHIIDTAIRAIAAKCKKSFN